MHIFLVNDDGIGAVGIMALMEAALERGHKVSMCAPSGQQSAASQRITLAEPLYVKDYPVEHPNARAFSITGTPADCVRLGLLGGLVTEPIDVLISGINNGYNAGMAIHYSGTVGAATEGALNGLHAIAASIGYEAESAQVTAMARRVIEVAERYAAVQVPYATVLNINAPALDEEQLKAPVYAPLAQANFLDGYERCYAERAGVYYWLKSGSVTEEPGEGTDQWYLNRGHEVYTLIGNPACQGQDLFDQMKLIG